MRTSALLFQLDDQFRVVATSAARYQDISLNPQKLAGQCAKLKCCLNYEVDAYVESVKQLPSKEIRLETKDNTYFYFKADIFSRMLTYTTERMCRQIWSPSQPNGLLR